MEFSQLSHTASILLLLSTLYITYRVIDSLSTWRRQRRIKLEKGTMEAFEIPQWDRFFGIDLFMKNMKALREHTLLPRTVIRFQENGVNSLQFVILGRRLHSTIEPENLKTIQAIDHKKWSLGERRKTAFHPLLGEGIFTTDGAAWQHSRDMLRPNFARAQVGDVETFERHIQHLINIIPTDGRTVDLSELFFKLTIDSATEFLFGESIESLTRATDDGFATAFNRSQDYIANSARWGPWAKLFPANKVFRQDAKLVHDFVDSFVQRSLAKQSSEKDKGRYIFMDELAGQTSDRLRIRSECLNILLAGRDTTASLLTNAWHTLAQRPDIWAKLQDEVASLQGTKPTFEGLKDLKYLRAFLNESLRLYPVVPLNSREAVEDTTLPLGGGPDGRAPLFIAKGSVVTWSVFAMHRRKDFYGADAEDFRPERWLDDPATGRKGLRTGWEYLPFNGGARICLGQQFALTEASYTTVRLLQAFSAIESRDDRPWTEALSLTCLNLHGAKCALTARE